MMLRDIEIYLATGYVSPILCPDMPEENRFPILPAGTR